MSGRIVCENCYTQTAFEPSCKGEVVTCPYCGKSIRTGDGWVSVSFAPVGSKFKKLDINNEFPRD